MFSAVVETVAPMKVMIVPLIVLSAVAGELSEEPNEAQMRGAFEQTLALHVRNAIEFVAENGGPQAVQQIRQNGTDRFELRAFQKRACARLVGQRSFRCDFSVAIDVVNGSLQHTLAGRFYAGPRGLNFAQEETEAPLPAVASVL
jgi:hypothetical protein